MPALRPSLLESVIFFGMAAAAGVALRSNAPARRVSALKCANDARLRIVIVTDAWAPQVNGVVRTLETLGRELMALGHEVRFATPEHHTTLPLPTYPEIR